MLKSTLSASVQNLGKTLLAAGAFLLLFNTTSWGVPSVIAGHVQLPIHLAAADPDLAPHAPLINTIVVSEPDAAPAAARLPAPAAPSEWAAPTAEEAEFLRLVNQSRAEYGLPALAFDPLLTLTARAHSAEMAEKNYFDHHSATPGLETPLTRYLTLLHSLGGATPHYALLGENIYYCSLSDATYNVAYGHCVLMNSPGHRANILDARYARAGIGIYRSDDGQFWVTEMFLKDAP